MAKTNTAAVGRPRDPEVDRKIMDGAMALFAGEGWNGFTMEGVAKASGVGKASIYLRWRDKEQLLLEAMQDGMAPYEMDTTADFRANLLGLAMSMLDEYATLKGQAFARLYFDNSIPTRLRDFSANLGRARIAAGRAVMKHGRDRGEVREDVSSSIVLDCLSGAVRNHYFASTVYTGAKPLKSDDDYARQLVDFLMERIGPTEGARKGQ